VSVIVALSAGSQTYRTKKGEKRVIALDDGSVATLNTATSIVVDYSKKQRVIRLKEGEALFDVAKNARRPFIVMAGETRVRAVGTSFTVARISGTPVQVLVREGIVDISRTTAVTEPPTRVKANTRAVVAPEARDIKVAAVDTAAVARELAWQEGRIVIQGETLAAAAAKFGRYSDMRIVIDNAELAREEVSGVFDANDPITFAKSMAISLNGRAEIAADEVRITRPSPP
jgi:transmembrane sensor